MWQPNISNSADISPQSPWFWVLLGLFTWIGIRMFLVMIEGNFPRFWFMACLTVALAASGSLKFAPAVAGGLVVLLVIDASLLRAFAFRRVIPAEALTHSSISNNPSAMRHYEAGRRHFERQDWEAAAEQLEQATAADPAFGEAWYLLGVTRGWLKDNGASAEAFRTLLALWPNSAVAHAGLAMALTESGRFAEAMESCRRALEIDPHSAQARSVQRRLQAASGW